MRPLTLRRNYKWIAATILVVCFFVAVLGNERVIPYVSSFAWSLGDAWPNEETEELVVVEEEKPDTLFQIDMMHEIVIEMDEDELETMILTYEQTEEKEFFHASVTIDGEYFEDVGIRLKGNSTLKSALGVKEMPNRVETEMDTPYLLKLNEFVSGQDYQGYEQIALRSQFRDTAMMREVLGYRLLDQMGIVAPQSAYSVITFNGEQTLYMITEVIVEEFVESYLLEDDDDEMGNLFKASPGAKLEYYGDDPIDYQSFEQKTNTNEEDWYQIIEFAEFISTSSDEEFEQSLGDYVDVASLLEYLAFCNIVVNMDSIAGNGNNYYLYQDPETDQFLVIPWDLNESFGGFWRFTGDAAELDIFFEGEERGAMNPGQMMQGGKQPVLEGAAFNNGQDGMMRPPLDGQGTMRPGQGFRPPKTFPEGFQPPTGFEPPQGFDPDEEPPEHKVMSTENVFLNRIFSIDSLTQQYLDTIEELLNNELSLNNMVQEIEWLQTFVDEANESYGFWEDTLDHEYGTKELLEFIRLRNEFLSEELRVENSN